MVYLLMSIGAIRTFGSAEGKVRIMVCAVVGILIAAGAIFGSFYKVTSPTIWAPGLALALLVIGFLSTFVLRPRPPAACRLLRPRQAASTQLADLSSALPSGGRSPAPPAPSVL